MFTDPVSQVYPFVLVVLLQGIGVKVIEWHTIRKVKESMKEILKVNNLIKNFQKPAGRWRSSK